MSRRADPPEGLRQAGAELKIGAYALPPPAATGLCLVHNQATFACIGLGDESMTISMSALRCRAPARLPVWARCFRAELRAHQVRTTTEPFRGCPSRSPNDGATGAHLAGDDDKTLTQRRRQLGACPPMGLAAVWQKWGLGWAGRGLLLPAVGKASYMDQNRWVMKPEMAVSL
jgi:hypothetical protein